MRVEVAEQINDYKNSTNKQNSDWFVFENRIRKVISEVMQPTVRRVEEVRDKILGQVKTQFRMQEMAEEMFLEIKELSSTRTESFKQEIIREMNTKMFDMKL